MTIHVSRNVTLLASVVAASLVAVPEAAPFALSISLVLKAQAKPTLCGPLVRRELNNSDVSQEPKLRLLWIPKAENRSSF